MTGKDTIGALIEGGEGGENPPRSGQDGENLPAGTQVVVVRLYDLIKDWRDGQPLDQDNRDFLMEYLLACPLPASLGWHGRRPKSDDLEIAEAAALDWGREYYEQVKSKFDTAELACNSVANKMLERYDRPLFVKNSATGARWSIPYLIDRLQRTASR
jgi:hypothetical protein